MLNFNFSEKCLGQVSPPNFVLFFSRKMFLIIHSINRLNFIVWLSLLLHILGDVCITVVCYPGCNVIKFDINLIFLIKLFCYITKSQDKNLNILRTKRAFDVKQKAFFIIFKGLSSAKNCIRAECASLILGLDLVF